MDDKKTDRALRDIQPVEVDGSVRFTSVSSLFINFLLLLLPRCFVVISASVERRSGSTLDRRADPYPEV